MSADPSPQVPAAFHRALAEFNQLVAGLESPENEQVDVEAVWRAMEIGVEKVKGLLYEGWLAERAKEQSQNDVAG